MHKVTATRALTTWLVRLGRRKSKSGDVACCGSSATKQQPAMIHSPPQSAAHRDPPPFFAVVMVALFVFGLAKTSPLVHPNLNCQCFTKGQRWMWPGLGRCLVCPPSRVAGCCRGEKPMERNADSIGAKQQKDMTRVLHVGTRARYECTSSPTTEGSPIVQVHPNGLVAGGFLCNFGSASDP